MFLILLALISAHCFITAGSVDCGNDKPLEKCPSCCPSDFCPISNGPNPRYAIPKVCPKSPCNCGFNSRRAINGTCIPTRQCPAFDCPKPNEVYNSCPPYCPTDSCSQATPSGRCPVFGTIGIVVECRPTCRCKEGYWRNNGICVPYEQCPGVAQAQDNENENQENCEE